MPLQTSEKTGKILRIVGDRGFAFVDAGDGAGDYFLHFSEYDGDFTDLRIGDRIRFEPFHGEKGPRATHARLIGGGR
jgi:cold shock CspA family protein